MANFPSISSPQISQSNRIGKREIVPASAKKSSLPQDFIGSSATDHITFSINDGVVITITSRSTSSVDPNIRLGAVPFMIAFFEAASLAAVNPGTNQIPFDVATGRYDIYGPFNMPDFMTNGRRFITSSGTHFATDGNNLVNKTAIRNSSGGAQTVTALIQVRIIQSRGGGES